jgi:phospholipase C
VTRSPHRRPLLAGGAVAIAVAAVAVAVLFASGGQAARARACLPYRVRQRALHAPVPRAAFVPDFSHVVVIAMENKECSQVLGSPQAPYLNRLGRRYAVLRDMYATMHPSFPNYLALTSGATLGARATCARCRYRARNLVDELEAAHLSWRAYMEGMPSACYRLTRAGPYAERHDPFLFYTDIRDNPRRCADVVPLTRLREDLRAGRLPRFAWITPNLCHDMHDCGVRAGDAFLARIVPPLLRGVGRRGVVIVTWDEGTTKRGCCGGRALGGNIPTIIAGGAVRAHAAPVTAYDAYSILRTIEDAWRLPRLRAAACPCTPVIGDVWRRRATP